MQKGYSEREVIIISRKTREQRLQEIWAAAKKVFLEKGYHKTTMEDIIAETELSKGGFYHYYNNTKEIIIDMMKQGSLSYIKHNPYMIELSESSTKEQKKEILLKSILDKALSITDDKRVYTMFLYEMMNDPQIWAIYLELEVQSIEALCKLADIDYNKHVKEMNFISRFTNSLLVSHHMFKEPDVFENERLAFKKFLSTYIDAIFQLQ
ncbi:TetR/AcrR family transcriptional regulator [Clostridiaceae bacterium M8S5]|nr:TetR/AcrR family transcriptional regulator [Clostridiaceae bacterium M8S5]